MKVLVFVTQFYRLGGAERLAVELAEELNARGVQADILSMYTKDLPGVPEAEQELRDRGIRNVCYLGMNIHPSLPSLVPAILRLRRMIRREGYDIVETSMVTPSIIAAWACRGAAATQVVGIHDVFSKVRYNTPKHRLWRYSVRANPNTRFYGISEYSTAHWIQYSGTRANRTRTVLNAIPDDCFNISSKRKELGKEFGLSDNTRVALFVGRLLKRKGIDIVYEALSQILEEQDLTLLYVGGEDFPESFFSDDAGLLGRLKARVKSDGLKNRVLFLGRRDDIPHLMASSDVLVHPARIEGFGLVLAEALAAGLPVVASDVEGIPEVLAGTDAIMVPPDDPVAVCEAVLTTLNRTSGQARVAMKKGRKRAEGFRVKNRVAAMRELFDDVVSDQF